MQLGKFQKSAKSAGIIVLLLLVLGSMIFLGRQASGFLAKASTCPATSISAKQVTANSAVISWETSEITQGMVEYGVEATSLTFSSPEAASGKTHNVPLTLLTPNTIYYYLVAIGNSRCDSTGQTCKDNCVPFSFTTNPLSPKKPITSPTSSPQPKPTKNASPTSAKTTGSGTDCAQVKANLGISKDSTKWSSVKEFDIDGNGVINGLDIIKCQKL